MTAYTGLRFSSGKTDFLPFIWGEIGLTQMTGRTNLSLAEKARPSFPGSRLPCSPPCSRRGSLGTRKKGSRTISLVKIREDVIFVAFSWWTNPWVRSDSLVYYLSGLWIRCRVDIVNSYVVNAGDWLKRKEQLAKGLYYQSKSLKLCAKQTLKKKKPTGT